MTRFFRADGEVVREMTGEEYAAWLASYGGRPRYEFERDARKAGTLGHVLRGLTRWLVSDASRTLRVETLAGAVFSVAGGFGAGRRLDAVEVAV